MSGVPADGPDPPLAGIRADLDEITLHIAQDSLDAALRLVDRLDSKLKLLAWMPKLGPERPELGKDVRSLPLGRYLSIYVR